MKSLSKDSASWLEVDEASAGQRIDNFLLRLCKGVPKSHVYRILRSGEVRVNKKRVGPEWRLQPGDRVRLPPIRLAQQAQEANPATMIAARAIPSREFVISYEDAALLVIDKPAGLAVHGGSGLSFGVIEQLRRMRPEAKFLELAHRLDRETSGLLIIAKKRSALSRLHDDFRFGRIRKRYLALVKGRWLKAVEDIRLPLYKFLTAEGERRVRVPRENETGKDAHSIARLVARWQNYSLLEVELRTGRTHQIRVHLAHLGFPLLGDDKYGDFELNKRLQKQGLKRMFLHASRLRFKHPLPAAEENAVEELQLMAELPVELQAFLQQLNEKENREYGQAV